MTEPAPAVKPVTPPAVKKPAPPKPHPLPVGPAALGVTEVVGIVVTSAYAAAGPVGLAAAAGTAAVTAAAAHVGRRRTAAHRASRSATTRTHRAGTSRMGSGGLPSGAGRRSLTGRRNSTGAGTGAGGTGRRGILGRRNGSRAAGTTGRGVSLSKPGQVGTGGHRRAGTGARLGLPFTGRSRAGTGRRSGTGTFAGMRKGKGVRGSASGARRGFMSSRTPRTFAGRVARQLGGAGAWTVGAGWGVTRGTGRLVGRGVRGTGRGAWRASKWAGRGARRAAAWGWGTVRPGSKGKHRGKYTPRHVASTVRRRQNAPKHAAGKPVPGVRPAPVTNFRPGAGTITGGSTVSGFLFAAEAAQMRASAAKYDPESMMTVLHDFEKLPEALLDIAEAFRIIVDKVHGEFPLDPVIGDALAAIYQLEKRGSAVAGNVPVVMRKKQAADIARHESPRKGETKWDVGRA